jgi:hypothetical protein
MLYGTLLGNKEPGKKVWFYKDMDVLLGPVIHTTHDIILKEIYNMKVR